MSTPATPIPARFRWLKRLALVSLLLVVSLLGLRLVSGYVWKARFESALQAIRDRGEPIDVEDFQMPLPQDKDNAAFYVKQALQSWPTAPGSQQSLTDIEAYLASCEPVFALIQQAREAPSSHWGYSPQSPIIDHFYKLNIYLGHDLHRLVFRLMRDAAERAVQAGQYAQAIRIIRQIYELSESLYGAPGCVISYYGTNSVRRVASYLIESQLPLIDVKQATPALTEELRRLIEVMQDEDGIRKSNRDAMMFERMFDQDNVAALANGAASVDAFDLWGGPSQGPVEVMQHWLLRPLYYRDGCAMLSYYEQMIEAAGSFDPDRYEQIEAEFAYLENEGWRSPLGNILAGSFNATQPIGVLSVTHQRLALTAVAIKLYEVEQGRPIASLDDLVPRYLAAVPADPMDPNDGPIRYQPEGANFILPSSGFRSWLTDEQIDEASNRKLPILYSMGRNRIDNGGGVRMKSDGSILDKSRYYPARYGKNAPNDHWFLLASAPEPIRDPHLSVNYRNRGYRWGYGSNP